MVDDKRLADRYARIAESDWFKKGVHEDPGLMGIASAAQEIIDERDAVITDLRAEVGRLEVIAGAARNAVDAFYDPESSGEYEAIEELDYLLNTREANLAALTTTKPTEGT
jgi:hypothetical protein